MNAIFTTRYVITIIFGQDTLLIIGTINHWNLNKIWIYEKYIVVEKQGFGALKQIILIMLLF
jgi:hypothetical protein